MARTQKNAQPLTTAQRLSSIVKSCLEKQCKTVENRRILQTQSIFGGEAKPLPYLLAQMNLVLHGLESPKIDPLNSLRFPLREIGDKDRVDVIMTNPPFGGEEERGILGNFPEDKQTPKPPCSSSSSSCASSGADRSQAVRRSWSQTARSLAMAFALA